MNLDAMKDFTTLCQSSIAKIVNHKSAESAATFLSCVCRLTHSSNCVLILSEANSEDATLIFDESSRTIERWELLDYIDLMHQFNDLTHLNESAINKLKELSSDKICDEIQSAVYVTCQVTFSNSLTLVLLRDGSLPPFSKESDENNKVVGEFLTTALSMIATGEHAQSLEREYQAISRERSVWMESLAWINESKVDETQKASTFEFYQKLLFQLTTLVNVKDTFLVEIVTETDLEPITHEGDERQFEQLKSKIQQIVQDNINTEERFFKLTQTSDRSEEEHVLVVLLRVQGRCRLVAALVNSESFSLLQTMIIRLFCDGVENILERRELIGSVKEQNELLKQEKEEQKALIDKLKATQEQLLQSEKMASIGQLAAGVAHEINNPVGFISSNLRSMKSYLEDFSKLLDVYQQVESQCNLDEQQRKAIEACKQEIDFEFLKEDCVDILEESFDGVDRVKKIVNDLKDFSRIGKHTWEICDIHEGIESTLNIVRNEIKYKATVEKDFAELPEIECIPSQLNQVFLNLFVNASHAFEDQGVIQIKTYSIDANTIGVSVSDNGKGIPAEVMSRIFDPFFTTKPIGKGTGLGLSLSYGIIERHAGKISVESEVGKGTCFTIELPIKQTEEQKAEGSHDPEFPDQAAS